MKNFILTLALAASFLSFCSFSTPEHNDWLVYVDHDTGTVTVTDDGNYSQSLITTWDGVCFTEVLVKHKTVRRV